MTGRKSSPYSCAEMGCQAQFKVDIADPAEAGRCMGAETLSVSIADMDSLPETQQGQLIALGESWLACEVASAAELLHALAEESGEPVEDQELELTKIVSTAEPALTHRGRRDPGSDRPRLAAHPGRRCRAHSRHMTGRPRRGEYGGHRGPAELRATRPPRRPPARRGGAPLGGADADDGPLGVAGQHVFDDQL
jgi:hypothetical protein